MSKTTKPQKPKAGEIASESKLDAGLSLYTGGIISNPDEVLNTRGGGDLKVYKELLRDDQVASCYQQRQLAITSREIIVEPASDDAKDQEIAEFVKAQVKALNFDDITKKMHYAIHYGYNVAEILWKPEGNQVGIEAIRVRPRYRFAFSADRQLFIKSVSNPLGMKAPERKFWTLTHGDEDDSNPYGLGLAHTLYWLVFFKRNAMKFWMVYLEKYAQPTAVGKLPPGQAESPTERDKVLDILDAIQVDSGVAIPDNVVVELIEATRSGSADYSALEDRMDKAISKVILSQTMTTDNGSSQAQATVHAGVKEEVVKADADLLCETFNQTVVKWLVEYNWPGATPPRVYRDFTEEEDLSKRAERDTKISNLGFEPTLDYITDTYGPGWVKKAAPILNAPAPTDPIPAEFTEISDILQKRLDHRANQEDIANAAKYLAELYEAQHETNLHDVLKAALEANDYQEFNAKIAGLVDKNPTPEQTTPISKATFFSRLAGMLQAQREK